jgi:hypothetical protein
VVSVNWVALVMVTVAAWAGESVARSAVTLRRVANTR